MSVGSGDYWLLTMNVCNAAPYIYFSLCFPMKETSPNAASVSHCSSNCHCGIHTIQDVSNKLQAASDGGFASL